MIYKIKKYGSDSLFGGFTLIEIMVVISIIGLLSSIILVAVNSARKLALTSSGMTFSINNRSALYDDTLLLLDFTNATRSGSALTIINQGSAIQNTNTGATPLIKGGAVLTVDNTLHNSGQYLFTDTDATYPVAWYENSKNSIYLAAESFNFTMSIWVKASNLNLTNGNMVYRLSDVYDTAPRAYIKVENGRINAYIADIKVIDGPTLDTNRWVNIVFSVKQSSNIAYSVLYIDGHIAANSNANTSVFSFASTGSATGIVIGGQCCSLYGLPNAYYDDIAFYKKSLLASEIQELYAEGLSKHLAITQ